jgi:hypothetical protein
VTAYASDVFGADDVVVDHFFDGFTVEYLRVVFYFLDGLLQ